MSIQIKDKEKDSVLIDNMFSIVCFGIFAAAIFYSNNRALPDAPRFALVEQTEKSVEPNMALLQYDQMQNDFSVREFRVMVR